VSDRLKRFSLFVVSFVVVTGVGFGCLAGMIYGETGSVCFGGVLGAVGGYVVAKLYLYWLMAISTHRYSKFLKWFFGSLAGMFCGVICTTFIHVMLGIGNMDWYSPGEMLLIMSIAEFVGIGAGFVVGGICTLVYFGLVAGQSDGGSCE